MSLNNNSILSIEEEWDVYFCYINNKIASIRLNLELHKLAPIDQFDQLVCCTIPFMTMDANGLNTDAEFQTICNIEDVITAHLHPYKVIFAGTIKCDGEMRLYFYSSEKLNFSSILNTALISFPNYDCFIQQHTDAIWDTYQSKLYPTPFEYQTILNKRTILKHAHQGDNLSTERLVHHYINFKALTDADLFIQEASEIGLSLTTIEEIQDADYPIELCLSKNDHLMLSNVNNFVWELVQLADKYDGMYIDWVAGIVQD